jgi:uncharacterized protein
MNVTERNKPLTDDELDHLDDFLTKCGYGCAMSVEELDGFFAALIAGPEIVPPSEYLPEVFAGEPFEGSDEEHKGILDLLMRHWNTIADTLERDEFYYPLFYEDENGVMRGNAWALGFMQGVSMCLESWRDFLEDGNLGYLFPMMFLAHEHDPDPGLRPPPPTPEQREELLARMILGLLEVYRHFKPQRYSEARRFVSQIWPKEKSSKVGRNEHCPCGSGKKYKRCHGASA